jgi:hypothetical protein
MLTDVRDVLMQRDPFAFPFPNALCCALENPRITIGQCPWNSGWVKSLFGRRVLEQMVDERITCSGVMFGPRSAIVEYLELMTEFLASPLKARNVGSGGLDQGVLNYLIWTRALEGIHLFEHGEGPVLHMAWMPGGEVRRNQSGQVLSRDGEPIHVLHQYDRHPEIVAFHKRRLSAEALRSP